MSYYESHLGSILAVLALFCAGTGRSQTREPEAVRPYLDAAQAAERWLAGVAQEKDGRRWWSIDPKKPERVATHLYSGVAGVVLFYLELHAATGEAKHLETARAGARYLASTFRAKSKRHASAALYTGLAGVALAISETGRATGDEELATSARELVGRLRPLADADRTGVTDIIAGKAGVGLFQLTRAGEASRKHAVGLGDALLDVAKPASVGKKWPMSPRYARLMPNFSHGTAGIGFFLAVLHERTGEQKYLDAALEGARYLQRISGERCLAMHHEPGGEELFYLGWCHGPAGTGRLYYKLFQITKDKRWLEMLESTAVALIDSGIPEKRTPGFWNNVGMCCGNAGVADFFVDLYEVTKKEKYLAFAKRMADDLIARATKHENGGLSWVHAEHRVRPKLLQAQTGYAQGAAGIGLALLKLDAVGRRKVRIRLPDSPFGGSKR